MITAKFTGGLEHRGDHDGLHFKYSFASELSRGMRQKLSIAAALLHDPAALLLDEPLSGLDPRGIRSFYATVAKRAQAGAAVVLSSHWLGQIESFCTRFLILHEGRCLLRGSKSEIAAQLPALRADASLEEIFFAATTPGTDTP